MTKGTHTHPGLHVPHSTGRGAYLTECWCQCELVPTTPDRVWAGDGETCGRPWCHAPEATA